MYITFIKNSFRNPNTISQTPRKGLTGLINLHPLMNTILQCLSNCTSLRNYFLNNDYYYKAGNNSNDKVIIIRRSFCFCLINYGMNLMNCVHLKY
jgi:hypothetical protein